ncbi:MAG: peptide-methionine (S)-S-oxide reductase MsrA [Oscillospiraceae bacterium]|jgi:peptide methionine sulfoxide reductase msrA/msrB|nr:peptide-methionine (S)-S-oxide reductase MsrA [Oscillospiraceae bacterium]
MVAKIYLAGGCFWGVEKYVGLIPGVTAARVGYANGATENPTYQQVCHEGTGHAETVEVEYDPDILPLSLLLDKYFLVIDPTSLNRQGHDTGAQYRTGIYWTNPDDRQVVEEALRGLRGKRDKPIVVEAEPLRGFYPAEEYHQQYLRKNPGGYCHIGPDMLACAGKRD